MENKLESIYMYLCRIYPDIKRYNIEDGSIFSVQRIEAVYSCIIVSAVKMLINRGLCSTYKEVHNVEMSSPRGRINIAESIRKQSLNKGKLVCSYNEYTNDIEVNQIIKTALIKIMDEEYISVDTRRKIINILKSFNGVSIMESHKLRTCNIRYNNNSYRYKPVIWLIKQLFDGNNDRGDIEYRLYKSQLHESILKSFEGYNVHIDTVKINTSKELDNLNDYKLGTGVGVRTAEKGILIRTEKFSYNGDSSNIEDRLSKDIIAYEREYGVKVSGLILAVNCDIEDILIREDESCGVDDVNIIRTFINVYDDVTLTDNKLHKLIKEMIGA